jgi:hypothetical protein
MTAYVLTGNCNIDQLGTLSPSGSASARAGGDTVDTNGFKFTIDQDTRYGLTGGSTLSLGSITINAAKGGDYEINATQVRQIPYDTGSGNVPAYNTVVSQGGVSGKLIRVQSAINATPTAVGAAMPASGFITVKQVSGGAYAAGALTGIGANATGADVVGFIELVGDESATVNCNRLGTFRIRGAWYDLGTTSGSSATTYQLPTNGSVQYFPGVQVETSSGSGVYEWWPCAGSLVAASSTATDERGKCCWISTAGVLRFGSDGTNTVGQVPGSGRKIRVPNILTAVCTVAARGTNALPNATLGTRYDFTTTGGGVIDFDKVNLAWYPSISQAYSVSLVDVGILTQLSMSEVAQPATLTRVCVGQEAANTQTSFILNLCFAGGTISDCHFTRAALGASGAVIFGSVDVAGFTFSNCRFNSRLVKANAGAGTISLTRARDLTFTNTKLVGGKVIIAACSNITFTSTSYADVVTGTTASTAVQNNTVWELATAASSNLKFDGLDFFGLTNVHPYLNLLSIAIAGCSNIKLRNIGTSPSSPLSLGSANQTGSVVLGVSGGATTDLKVQRVFVSNTRTNLYSTFDNTFSRITFENVMGDYADVPVATCLNMLHRSVGATPTYAAQTGVYGTHWWDHFTSATVGRIAIVMNETTSLTTNEVALTNGAAFTAAGGLYMPTIGMTATFTMPYFAKGHNGFANSALVMAGGTAGNYTYAYQIDTGSGFGSWSSELTAANLGTALNGLGAISPSTGFKLKLRITTSTGNTTAITSVYVVTSTSATDQANYFPLDTFNLTLTGLQSGSDVVVYQAGTTTVRSSADSVSSFVYTYETPESVDIGVFKAGYIPFYIRGYSLASANASLPVAQVVDRAYLA